MSLLDEILHKDATTVPVQAKQLAHLINLVKIMGWTSFMDNREIRPNIRAAQLYIRKHSKELVTMFNEKFANPSKNDIVDLLNPFLTALWHVRMAEGIIDPTKDRLELLINNSNNNQ